MAAALAALSEVQTAICYSDIKFPSLVEKKESIFVSVCRRILVIIKKIFQYYVVAGAPKVFSLSKRQIGLINRSHSLRRKPAAYPLQTPIKVKIQPERPAAHVALPINTCAYDSSLEGLIQFFDCFSDLLINECVLNDQIKPILPDVKSSLHTFFSEIQSWAGVFRNIRDSGSSLINGLKAVDDPTVTLIVQQMLQYFVSLDRQTIYNHLTKRLEELYTTGKISEEQLTQGLQYIDPVLSWLYHSNNWFLNTSQPANLHYFISDTFRFLDTLVKQISAGSLSEYFQYLKDFINEELDEEIEELFRCNTQPITRILARRLSDLIEQLPFAESFDQFIHAILCHTEGWISAEQARREQEQLVQKAKEVSKTRANNAAEVSQKYAADKLFEAIKKDGGVDHYLANELIWAFSNLTICNQTIKQCIQSKQEGAFSIQETEIYKSLIETLFPLLVPNSQYELPYGLEIEINGILEIAKQITLTKKFAEIRDRSLAEFDSLIDQSDLQKKENFREYFCAVIEVMIFECVQSRIKEEIARSIQSLIDRLSTKQYLDFLLITHLLPSLVRLCLKGYVGAYISANIHDLSQNFYHMYIGHRQFDFETLKSQLLESLYIKIQQKLIDFNMGEAQIGQSEFSSVIEPLVDEIYSSVKLQAERVSDRVISIKDIRKFIQKYFDEDSVPINNDYGTLAMNLLFRVGSFGGWFKEKFVGWFHGSISASASHAVNDIRKDHKKLVNSIVDVAKDSFCDADQIRETFFAEALSPEALEELNGRVSCELPKQIKHLSAIIHDLFYQYLKSRREPGIQYFTPATNAIRTVISDVLNKLFQHQILNKNLILSLTDVLQNAFRSANQKLVKKSGSADSEGVR